MAIVQFGTMVVGARGTIGGATFSANKSGPFVRAWSRGGNPRTPRQTDNRNVLAKFAIAWGDLTQAQRDDWDDYADDPAQEKTNSLGIDFFASGFNWFIQINSALAQVGLGPRNDAPTITKPAAPTLATLNFGVGGPGLNTFVQFTLSDPDILLTKAIFLRVYNSDGRQVASSGLVFMINDEPDGARRVFFQDEVEEAFGTIQSNMIGFSESYHQDAQGQRGPTTASNDTA